MPVNLRLSEFYSQMLLVCIFLQTLVIKAYVVPSSEIETISCIKVNKSCFNLGCNCETTVCEEAATYPCDPVKTL